VAVSARTDVAVSRTAFRSLSGGGSVARIDWKDVLSLELTDCGFDFSVVSEFRARLLKGGAEELL